MSAALGVRLLAANLRPQRGPLLRAAAWTAVGAAPSFASGLVVAAALDRGFVAGRPWTGIAYLAVLGALYGVSALAARETLPALAAAVEPARDGLVRAVARGVLERALAGRGARSGEAVAQLTEQVETVRGLLSALLRSARALVAPIVGAVVGLFTLSPLVGAIVVPPLVAALALYGFALRRLAERQRAVVRAGEAIGDVTATIVAGRRDIAACGADAWASNAAASRIAAEAAAVRALGRAESVRTVVVALGAQAPLVALLAVSPTLLREHRMTVGTLAGAVAYVVATLQPALASLVQIGGGWILNLVVVLARLAEVADAPPLGAARAAAAAAPESGDLALDDVTFAWSPTAAPVIDRLSLELPAGSHIAVVGPSGIGKSTLAALVARLATPSSGRILVGGRDLRDIEETALRRDIALIPQEAYVFAGTVRENVTYLKPHVSAKAVHEAIVAVGLEATVARLGGLDVHLTSGGGGLSAGERQLIALARVWLSPARIVVLDEASCHLDPATEARAERSILRRGGTVIVIAHRMSSALRADRILVLDGVCADFGTHEELVARNALYRELAGRDGAA